MQVHHRQANEKKGKSDREIENTHCYINYCLYVYFMYCNAVVYEYNYDNYINFFLIYSIIVYVLTSVKWTTLKMHIHNHEIFINNCNLV